MAKTLKIAELIAKANHMLQFSRPEDVAARTMLQTFIADILLQENVYAGFGYVTPYSDPNCDKSRIFFYVSSKL